MRARVEVARLSLKSLRGHGEGQYIRCEIPGGATITKDVLIVVRPSPEGGLASKYLKNIIGKKAKVTIKKGDCLKSDVVDI